jgi:metal-dependent amidase/aminoacylase/carboxypeptidase family protein
MSFEEPRRVEAILRKQRIASTLLDLAMTQKVTMAKYRIMYWKHIPQSITVEGEGRTIKKQLSQKIQDKIDAYAMAEGLTSATDYAAQYKRGDWVERDGTPEEVADALLPQLEAEFAKIEIPRR